MNSIVLGGGCFWCLEAVYQRVKGIEKVVSGYGGGDIENPTYNNHGNHAEVVELIYDNNIISLEKILEIFFYIHDPTTLNRQGNDIGEQYRSIILCCEDEVGLAEKAKTESQRNWHDPIVTEIKILNKFYKAEDYHQNYYNSNSSAGYCQVIINPKLAKFEARFQEYLKK
jgi:methionine-S-sulfoxide reductase